MPDEDIALMCRRVDRSGTKKRHETEVQDELDLGAKHLIAHEESAVPQASKSTRSCVSVLSSRPSNRSGVIAFLTPFVVIRYRGYQRLTTGQPWADNMECRTNGSADGHDDLQTERRDCGSPKHTQSKSLRKSCPLSVRPQRGGGEGRQ
jgi:hypothetical protein